jgi:hypothetical protein
MHSDDYIEKPEASIHNVKKVGPVKKFRKHIASQFSEKILKVKKEKNKGAEVRFKDIDMEETTKEEENSGEQQLLSHYRTKEEEEGQKTLPKTVTVHHAQMSGKDLFESLKSKDFYSHKETGHYELSPNSCETGLKSLLMPSKIEGNNANRSTVLFKGVPLKHAKTFDATVRRASDDVSRNISPTGYEKPNFEHIPLEKFGTLEPGSGGFKESLDYRMRRNQESQSHMTIHAFTKKKEKNILGKLKDAGVELKPVIQEVPESITTAPVGTRIDPSCKHPAKKEKKSTTAPYQLQQLFNKPRAEPDPKALLDSYK